VNLMAQPIHTHELTVRETDPARPG
jgi:hypothetical protein